MADKKRYEDSREYYSRTSEARVLRRKKATPEHTGRRKKKTKKQKMQVFKQITDNRIGITPYAMITILMLFVGFFTIVYASALYIGEQKDISRLTNDLVALQEENNSLQAEILDSYDMEEIRKIATTKLGMSSPKEHQIIHITVPKQSYVVQNKPIQEDSAGYDFFSKIVNFFSNLISIK